MGRGSETPEDHRQRIAQSRAQPVDEPADHYHAKCVGSLKGEDKIAVVDLVPSEVVLQRGLEHAKHLAIHVVLGDAEEKQRTDDPAKAAEKNTGRVLQR